MLYDLMISMENVTSVGAIVGKELAKSFVIDIFENGLSMLDTSFAEALYIIENEEFMYVSVLNCPDGYTEYTIQELYYGDTQALIEDDIIFIEDNLLDVFDRDRTFGEIVIIDDNEDIEEEIVEAELTVAPIKPVVTFYDIVDDMVEYTLDVIAREKCPRCLRAELEEILINAYEYGIE